MNQLVERLNLMADEMVVDEEACADLLTEAATAIADLEAQVDRMELDGIHSCGPTCQRTLCVLRREKDDLEALRDELGEALVTAMIPIEAILLSGADSAHCQDVRDAMRDAQTTARATLAKLEKARG